MKTLPVIVALLLTVATANAREENPNIDAIWLRQVVSFTYQADRTLYTCNSLWQKISRILSHLGARTRPANRINCNDFADSVTLRIELEAPVEATAANILAVTDYRTEDMLVARLQNRQLPDASSVPRFPAVWSTISFRDSALQLAADDCELVQQLRRQILPKLSVQVLKEPSRCTAALSRGGLPPTMKVRALTVAG